MTLIEVQQEYMEDWPQKLSDFEVEATLQWLKENRRQRKLFRWIDPEPGW